MQSTPSLPLLSGPLWNGVVAPDKVLSMGQIEWFDISTLYKQMTYAKLNSFKKKFDYSIVTKQATDVKLNCWW